MKVEDDCIFEMLDKLYISTKFQGFFHTNFYLPINGFDHGPLLLSCENKPTIFKKPFRILNF